MESDAIHTNQCVILPQTPELVFTQHRDFMETLERAESSRPNRRRDRGGRGHVILHKAQMVLEKHVIGETQGYGERSVCLTVCLTDSVTTGLPRARTTGYNTWAVRGRHRGR